jgi:hypothetical protein
MATKSEGKKKADKADSNKEHEADNKSKAAHQDEETQAKGKKKSAHKESADNEHDRDDDQAIGNSDLKALVEQLENELSSMDHEAAIAIIDQWHSALESSDDEALAEVVDSLNELKNVLTGYKTDEVRIADALADLSEQVIDYAEAKPPKGTKGSLKKLGNLLSKLAESTSHSLEEEEDENEEEEDENEEEA